MDALKKELEKKKRDIALAKKKKKEEESTSLPSSRYLRAADLRRIQEEQEEEERRKKRKRWSTTATSQKEEEEGKPTNDDAPKEEKRLRTDEPGENQQSGEQPAAATSTLQQPQLKPSEVTKQLRELGLPVRLFGERTIRISSKKYDDLQRLQRLAEAMEQLKSTMAGLSEMDEFRLGSGHGIRNPFLGGKRGDQQEEIPDDSPAKRSANEVAKKVANEEAAAEERESEDDPHKRIHRFFKKLLRQWEDDLGLRPEAVKRTAAGKNETKTLKQCKDYIRPLFKLCKTRRLEPSLMANILKIVDYCEEGEFVKAHDAYMDVAIGRAAWPIGVTMVGIHARSGRAKIESSNVAHVMNSELQRKYLTSVKRLMSYCQKKREDVAPSKKVMN